MRPDFKSIKRLGVTQSKAKMYEYNVPDRDHIKIYDPPSELFPLTIGILGDLASDGATNTDFSLVSQEALHDLQFAARFFDSYIQANLTQEVNSYLLLIGSAAYYLCNLQGSSQVLANKLNIEDFQQSSMEMLLLFLLKANYNLHLNLTEGEHTSALQDIASLWINYLRSGDRYDDIKEIILTIRDNVYARGSAKELLHVDLISAILNKKYFNSCWYALPKYSGISKDIWSPVITKSNFINELWPSQHLLGHHNVLKGSSAVIQMPTSAGKTKASELIIRSSFLSERSNVAMIVAPFRALCHEIKNDFIRAFQDEEVLVSEISDVLQKDVDIFELLSRTQKKILVLTPEKLLYILRQDQNIATKIGLIIFDEGHQFDSGNRGITYELLLTTLKNLLSETTQKVLISAVISNANEIGHWLNGEGNQVVEGSNISPTYKTVGFASWLENLGQIRFVSEKNIDEDDFFVPRILDKTALSNLPRETTVRYFPEREDGNSVALFLGLKLVGNGGVAIFCGNRDTPRTIAKIVVDLDRRNYRGTYPAKHSNPLEIQRLKNLIELNLGEDSIAVQAAKLGVFMHHSRIPQGIRIAVEHSMREGLIKLVVCTSTLAQGVNLPIRYLIVTSIYQAGKKLNVRDFHNLIGRAGRAGMHTEGSILFADPELYDKRRSSMSRWNNVKFLLNPKNSEACTSNLLSIFDPFTDRKSHKNLNINIIGFLEEYLSHPSSLDDFINRAQEQFFKADFTPDISEQIEWKISLLSAIQSFLMSHLDSEENFDVEEAIHLGNQTLAYHLANDTEKEKLNQLFQIIAENINQLAKDKESRKIYSQTLLGLQQAKEIEKWVNSNLESMISSEGDEDLLEILWPLLIKFIKNKAFTKCNDPDKILESTKLWISGNSYSEIFIFFQISKIKMPWGKNKFRDYALDHVIDIFDHGLSYEGSLIIGAVSNFISIDNNGQSTKDTKKILLEHRIGLLQKRLKYGLASREEVNIFEFGFCDRVIANRVYQVIGSFDNTQDTVKNLIKKNLIDVLKAMDGMPSYYQSLLENIR